MKPITAATAAKLRKLADTISRQAMRQVAKLLAEADRLDPKAPARFTPKPVKVPRARARKVPVVAQAVKVIRPKAIARKVTKKKPAAKKVAKKR